MFILICGQFLKICTNFRRQCIENVSTLLKQALFDMKFNDLASQLILCNDLNIISCKFRSFDLVSSEYLANFSKISPNCIRIPGHICNSLTFIEKNLRLLNFPPFFEVATKKEKLPREKREEDSDYT